MASSEDVAARSLAIVRFGADFRRRRDRDDDDDDDDGWCWCSMRQERSGVRQNGAGGKDEEAALSAPLSSSSSLSLAWRGLEQRRMVARMSRQSLIDLVCEATALQVSDAKSSSMGIVKLKQAQRSVPPDIDEPCSSGDEHETEYNAEAKLEADLAFFAQRMSSAKGRSAYQ